VYVISSGASAGAQPEPRRAGSGTAVPLLRIRNLALSFPGVKAVDGVDLDVEAGQVLCLCGHNGSGKSSIVKILAGLYRPDPGSVIETGSDMHFIHQDLGLIPGMTTVENLDLDDRARVRDLLPFRRSEVTKARQAVARFGGRFDVRIPVSEISPAERTIVAIARATSHWKHANNILVLDEPTATLHGNEAERLRAVVRDLAAQGAAILYISHHLSEVVDLGDRAVVLRDGRIVMDKVRGDFDEETLLAAISGDRVEAGESRRARVRRETSGGLAISGLSNDRIHDFDLTVRPGEIVGLSGLIGSGRDEVLGCVFGARRARANQVEVDERSLTLGSTACAVRAGVAYVPADRRGLGSIPTFTARENLTLASMTGAGGRAMSLAEERRCARDELAAVDVRPLDPTRLFTLFSGGNQQKIVIAKWLRMKPKVMLLDEPTQGVDVGARAGIHDLVREAAAAGAAVVVSSSDEKEIVGLCDRVVVLRDGATVAEFVGDDVTEDNLLRAALTSAQSAKYQEE
jgi:ABC-type sugar transport system ATPase subunit